MTSIEAYERARYYEKLAKSLQKHKETMDREYNYYISDTFYGANQLNMEPNEGEYSQIYERGQMHLKSILN